MNQFASVLRMVVGTIVVAVWTVVGFFLYVPLLARQIAVYSVVLVGVSLGRGNIERAQAALDRAIRFFPDGYSRIFRALFSEPDTGEEMDSLPVAAVNYVHLALEVVWSTGFWLITYYVVLRRFM